MGRRKKNQNTDAAPKPDTAIETQAAPAEPVAVVDETKCANCAFRHPADHGIQQCRRFPPVFVVQAEMLRNGIPGINGFAFPVVKGDMVCGEFKPVKD